MLVRAAARPAIIAASSAAAGSTRSFSSTPAAAATLRELESRIRSVKNIEKITKSMKMIATTRLGKAQKAMQDAKKYGAANSVLFTETKAAESDTKPTKILYIVVSSDRGLCGGIHSSVSKRAKKELLEGDGATAEKVTMVILGERPKAQLSKAIPDKLNLSISQIGKTVPSFADALAIADLIEKRGIEYDKVNIIYNTFVSAISFESKVVEIYNAEALKQSPNFSAYEVEDDDLVTELVSFSLANSIYAALVEGHAAEISSRRNAMDNASKNAGEMITKLQMQFNTKRQGAITNELVDIITGASAL